MTPFVFSCDAHIAEPNDLFTAGLPEALRAWAPNAVIDDQGMRLNRLGETVLFKIPANFHTHKVGAADDLDVRRRGARDLGLRFADMQRDGVDAELVFPSLGLLISRITDRAAAAAAARLYNDWARAYVAEMPHTLILAAVIPLVCMEDALAELLRIRDLGFKAVMMACQGLESMPRYNAAAWDPFFATCAEAGIPLVFHTGVGNVNIRALKGPGGALFNYTRQMNDAVDVIAALVGGGVLDRHPQAHVLFVECGAGWLLGLAERMDEVYDGHAPSISPKLQRRPGEIVRDQVHCSFQNDPGCLLTLGAMGSGNFLFATDYPHSEGTFPHSRRLVASMFDRVPAVTEAQKADILGLNAARMFKVEPQAVAAEAERLRARFAAAAAA